MRCPPAGETYLIGVSSVSSVTDDETSLSRFAQPLFVNLKRWDPEPPYYDEDWQPLYDAKIESITQNINAAPDEVVFWFPNKRWNDTADLRVGDKIQIVTENGTVLFEGFIVKPLREFSGGDEKGGKYERLAFICHDYRWLMAVSVPIYGQFGRGFDDYDENNQPLQSCTDFSGRRCIFNPIVHPARPVQGNCDPNGYSYFDEEENEIAIPLFFDTGGAAIKWTVYQMLRFVLFLIQFEIGDFIPIDFASYEYLENLEGWTYELNHILIEGLNGAAALQLLCKKIGWAFRLDYEGGAHLVFFPSGKSDAQTRDSTHPVIQQSLFAPAPVDADSSEESKSIRAAVEAGKVICQSAKLETDITNIVNTPIYFGARQRVEFTAELAPGWKDSDLIVPAAPDYFLSESDLAGEDNPNQFDFYKYYHTKGSAFKRDVGRIWVLNENGRYTGGDYDRGAPFDLSTILPAEYAFDEGKRRFGPFSREFLSCLTKNKFTDSTVGIVVEFSFDLGATWHIIEAAMENLNGQCGIVIKDPNLSEIKNPEDIDSPITGGTLDGVDLNYWTSLLDDKLAGSSFKNGEWYTRVRVTASIELDQRLFGQLAADYSGSPFNQVSIWDHSGEYNQQARDASSIFTGGDLSSDARDDSQALRNYVFKLRESLQDSADSGVFILERLWLDKFRIGDCITKIEGRDFDLRTALGAPGEGQVVLYPEIVQIEILVQQQKMKLFTRDLKYSGKK